MFVILDTWSTLLNHLFNSISRYLLLHSYCMYRQFYDCTYKWIIARQNSKRWKIRTKQKKNKQTKYANQSDWKVKQKTIYLISCFFLLLHFNPQYRYWQKEINKRHVATSNHFAFGVMWLRENESGLWFPDKCAIERIYITR